MDKTFAIRGGGYGEQACFGEFIRNPGAADTAKRFRGQDARMVAHQHRWRNSLAIMARASTPMADRSTPGFSSAAMTLELRKLLGRFVDFCQAIEFVICRERRTAAGKLTENPVDLRGKGENAMEKYRLSRRSPWKEAYRSFALFEQLLNQIRQLRNVVESRHRHQEAVRIEVGCSSVPTSNRASSRFTTSHPLAVQV